MVIFHSYVNVYQAGYYMEYPHLWDEIWDRGIHIQAFIPCHENRGVYD